MGLYCLVFINRIQNYGLFVKIYRFEQGRGFLMRKDRFNICISFYAVLAFVLAILGQTLLCGMLLGFVIAVSYTHLDVYKRQR